MVVLLSWHLCTMRTKQKKKKTDAFFVPSTYSTYRSSEYQSAGPRVAWIRLFSTFNLTNKLAVATMAKHKPNEGTLT